MNVVLNNKTHYKSVVINFSEHLAIPCAILSKGVTLADKYRWESWDTTGRAIPDGMQDWQTAWGHWASGEQRARRGMKACPKQDSVSQLCLCISLVFQGKVGWEDEWDLGLTWNLLKTGRIILTFMYSLLKNSELRITYGSLKKTHCNEFFFLSLQSAPNNDKETYFYLWKLSL